MKRRLISIPALFVAACLLLSLLPVWLPIAAVVDLVRGRTRLPIVRLLGFALLWSITESIGVLVAFGWWITGQSKRASVHFALQRWWAGRLMAALRVTCGVKVTVENAEALRPGPTILFARHASLADSLVSAYAVTSAARMQPRYVLKRELLSEPCLDVVGNRLPNHFLDRGAADSAPELAALSTLTSTMGVDDIGVIFPEGTRANPDKRSRALEKIASVDPARAARLGGLQHLLPPRPAGALAMLRGCPSADVLLAWHIGFEGLDTFGGILRAVGRPLRPVRFVLRRVPRHEVPDVHGDDPSAFVEWLDQQWLSMDREVALALSERN
jgi:1-acyl-sn-glycerol-3-phosphate acyltransferase